MPMDVELFEHVYHERRQRRFTVSLANHPARLSRSAIGQTAGHPVCFRHHLSADGFVCLVNGRMFHPYRARLDSARAETLLHFAPSST